MHLLFYSVCLHTDVTTRQLSNFSDDFKLVFKRLLIFSSSVKWSVIPKCSDSATFHSRSSEWLTVRWSRISFHSHAAGISVLRQIPFERNMIEENFCTISAFVKHSALLLLFFFYIYRFFLAGAMPTWFKQVRKQPCDSVGVLNDCAISTLHQ